MPGSPMPRCAALEGARKVNALGQTVTLAPGGPLADAAWTGQQLSRATQALPNGYCGLPAVRSCRMPTRA